MIVTMLVLALALSNPVAATQTAGHVDVNRAFNYVVVIVMENHGLRDVINVSSAPFMNQLASSYGLAVNYTAIDHPSLPNYLGLISGQDFSSWSSSDCSPRAGCSAGSAPNLVDSLENRGLTWKAYMEDYPSTCGSHCSPGDCFVGDNGAGVYAARHDPFVYFDDIANSTARCSRIVPAIPALAAVQMTSSYLTSHHHQQHQISCGLLLTVATTRTGSPITTVQSYAPILSPSETIIFHD